ncbi:uncharacterized protein DS421_16g551960 [Arachis hypogaea]|nr:uncharacterized protein DS421_16g551960 [Arachis hypogaea]
MIHLAELYEVKTRTFIFDVGNIRLNAELIGRVFGIPSSGNPFPTLDDENSAHVAIKKRFHRRTTTELRDLVYSCLMATESDRMEFRKYFLLVIMKVFLCPTTQQVISPWHIYPVLDVSDPRRFNWPLQTLKWCDMAVEKYKLKENKTCEGCMFVMLVLYFQQLQYGQLDNCHEHEQWLAAWTSEKSKRIWEYHEQLQYMEPLQTMMPTTPSCRTPSPPSHRISPGMTRMKKNPTQCTPIKVHPLLKGRKLDEDDEDRVRRWAVNASLGVEQAVASYEGRLYLILLREDLCTLQPRRWVNSNIVQWMCSTFNDSESSRFKDDFYCLPPEILRNLDSFREAPTLSYVGLGFHFGADSRYFDKVAASRRKWVWLVHGVLTPSRKNIAARYSVNSVV